MKKRAAFLISLLVALSFYLVHLYIDNQTSREEIVVSRVIDGDTLQSKDGRTIRLLNINSPEKNDPLSKLSYQFMKDYEGKSIEIEVVSTDKYKRTLARLYSEDYLNLKLVELGLASKFLVQESELKQFNEAEDEAVRSSLGIWNKSIYYGCVKSSIDSEEETITFKSVCGEINIQNWRVKDESRKIYFFDKKSFSSVTLHSGIGKDNESDLFWGQKDVWNNDRDTIYLFDENENIVLHESYGYD